jgi:hypothetical protein
LVATAPIRYNLFVMKAARRCAKVTVELNLEQLAQAILSLPVQERQRLWSLLATLEEAHDPGALKALQESEQDVQAGRLYTFAEVFGYE